MTMLTSRCFKIFFILNLVVLHVIKFWHDKLVQWYLLPKKDLPIHKIINLGYCAVSTWWEYKRSIKIENISKGGNAHIHVLIFDNLPNKTEIWRLKEWNHWYKINMVHPSMACIGNYKCYYNHPKCIIIDMYHFVTIYQLI